jgi:putative membrane protein
MLYLFLTSIVPTVPGAWLIFAEGAVYSAYDIPQRMFGISVTTDQQVAGAIMKLGAGTYLWVIITMLFFKWSAAQERADEAERIARHAPTLAAAVASEGPVPTEDPLTWQQVEEEFKKHPAPG